MEDTVFRRLKDRHGQEDLRTRYRQRRFPRDQTNHKPGGHLKELGCLHIDFIREDGGWHLERTWLCR